MPTTNVQRRQRVIPSRRLRNRRRLAAIVSAMVVGLVACARVSGQPPTGGPPDPRQPVPNRAAVESAEARIRTIFLKEFESAPSAESDREFADRLWTESQKTADDAAARFVLGRIAAQRALSGGDARKAFDMVTELTRIYRLPVAASKFALLKSALEEKSAARPARPVALNVETWGALLTIEEEALQEDDYPTATDVLDLLRVRAKASKDARLLRELAGREKDLAATQELYSSVRQAELQLADAPNDPESHLKLGRWACLVRRNWSRGLPHLACGSNAALAELAKLDLALPTESAPRVKLADGWRAAAEAECGAARTHLEERAAYWYQQAVDGLPGLDKTRVLRLLEVLREPSEEIPAGGKAPRHDYALAFDGVRSAAVFPKLRYDGTYPFTIEIVVTPQNVDNNGTVFGNTDSKSGWYIGIRNRAWCFGLCGANGGWVDAPSAAPAVAGRRATVTGQYDGWQLRLYVDGQLQPAQPVLANRGAPSIYPMTLGTAPGQDNGKPSLWYAGSIEYLRWTRAPRYLDNHLPRISARPEPSTLLLLLFNEGGGTMLHDLSGQGNHGSVMNSSWGKRR